MTITGGGNIIIGTATAAGTSALKVLALTNSATAPSASVDLAHLYAYDYGAGDARLYVYTEVGGAMVLGSNTLVGGSGSAGNLTLMTTSHATKGLIYLGSNLIQDEATGDTYWTGDGAGIPYGSCWGNEIAWSQATAAQNTWYNISDADMTDGSGGLNLMTHDGSGKITVTKAGRYLISYSISMSGSVANDHYMSGIEISGSGAAVSDGQCHYELRTANQEICLSSMAILDLAASATIEVAVATTDANTPTLSVDHLNIAVTMVGGT
jgi:hypothetical protein